MQKHEIERFYKYAKNLANLFLMKHPTHRHLKDDVESAASVGLVRAWKHYYSRDEAEFKKLAARTIWRTCEAAVLLENTVIIKKRTLSNLREKGIPYPQTEPLKDDFKEPEKEEQSDLTVEDIIRILGCTETERQILRMTSKGIRNKEIAKELNMSVRLLGYYLKKIKEKAAFKREELL